MKDKLEWNILFSFILCIILIVMIIVVAIIDNDIDIPMGLITLTSASVGTFMNNVFKKGDKKNGKKN